MPVKAFEDYDFETANKAFDGVKSSLSKVETNRLFLKGDDWQDGAGWVGPHFDGKSEAAVVIRKAIERDFASKGAIKSAVRRHRRGVIGRVPTWNIASRSAPANPEAAGDDATESPLIGEAQEILNEFWKNSRFHKTLQQFVEDYLTVGRAVLRLFFVQADESGVTPRAESIAEAVKRLHVFREEPESGVVVWNKETLKKASLFRYEKEGVIFIEMCYVADSGETVFKTLTRDGDADFARANFPTSLGRYAGDDDNESTEVVLPLGGKLLIFELSGEPFVSPAMRSQQKLVNKAYTTLSHNLDMDGFRTKKILNGLPPGKFEGSGESRRFIPDPNGETVGAGSITYTSGMPVVEHDGDGNTKTTFTTPQVHESEPIAVGTFIESADAASAAILEEADQKHIAISGDAAVSGESRIQAQGEYKSSLEDTKGELDGEVSECLEAVLAVTAYLMGNSNRYQDLQVTFAAILNSGPVSADQRRAALEEAEKGFRSRESAMELIGITDPDAMKAKIRLEAEEMDLGDEDEDDDPPPENEGQ